MKTYRKYKLSLFGLAMSLFAAAQQNSLFNTYALDPLQLNIAYSGATCTEANLHYRTQWIGMKEAPKVLQANAHTALGKSTGIGLRIHSQNMGLLSSSGITAGYAYRFRLNDNIKVHLGIGVGWSQSAIKAQKATVLDPNDVTLSTNNRQTANGFDSEFGAMVFGDKFKAGISALHLYNSNPDFTGNNGYKILPQINTQFSYVFFKDKKIELEPWVLNRLTLKGDNVVEGILKVNFLNSFTAGAGYRTGYGMLLLFGAHISHVKVAYSIDYGTNKNAVNLGTSHQIMLGFSLCKKTKNPVTENSDAAREENTNPLSQTKEEPKSEQPTPVEPKKDTAAVETPVTPAVIENPKEETIIKESPASDQIKEDAKPETKPTEAPKQEVKNEEPKKEMVQPVILPPITAEELNPIATKVVFEKNSQALSGENLALIKKSAEIIKKRSGNVVVVGYASTDGDKAHNIDLAIHRAEVVKQALIRFGVKADRLVVKNGGATDSVNTSLEGNRTVRFE